MTASADADAAVEHLVALDDRGLLPFAWYQFGPREGRVEVVVPASDRQVALDYFAAHPLRPAPDSEPVPVEVAVRAGASWGSEPGGGAREHPDPDALVGLVGLDVDEAASRATAGGWLVRAHEPEALLTVELRRNRVNLQYAEDRTVVSVQVG